MLVAKLSACQSSPAIMVFESAIADIINRTLSVYVDNLDVSQLNLGISNGDVILSNLHLKESALKELNLPIRVVKGQLSFLRIKLAWLEIWNISIDMTIDGVYLLAVPESSCDHTYDEEKARAELLEKKRKVLKQLEELDSQSTAQLGFSYNFVGRMVGMILRNVRIDIKNIHIRYEDKLTAPGQPFSLGLVIGRILMENGDDTENTHHQVVDSSCLIHKNASIECFSLYFNTNSIMYSGEHSGMNIDMLQNDIALIRSGDSNFECILAPISLDTFIVLNTMAAELNYTAPNIQVILKLNDMNLQFSRRQYHVMIALLESAQRWNVGAAYLQYRPQMMVSGNARIWWAFAINCILHEHIRRQKQNWSWRHMRNYRHARLLYGKDYKLLLQSSILSEEVARRIGEAELQLDIVTLVEMRTRVQKELNEEKTVFQRIFSAVVGFCSKAIKWLWTNLNLYSHFIAGYDEAKLIKDNEFVTKALSETEQEKLLKALLLHRGDYIFRKEPKSFQSEKVIVMLDKVSVRITDGDLAFETIIQLRVESVNVSIVKRTSAAAVRVDLDMATIAIDGVQLDKQRPVIMRTINNDLSSFLHVTYEKCPLDNRADHCLQVISQSLEVVYHSETIRHLVRVFRPLHPVDLSQIQSAAVMKLNEFKNASALKLQYLVENHESVEMDVHIRAPRLKMPEQGDEALEGRVLLVDLGEIKLKSVVREKFTVSELFRTGLSLASIYSHMSRQAYDWFNIDIANVEIVLIRSGESLLCNRTLHSSIINPLNITMEAGKCLTTSDCRLPIIKLSVHVPAITLKLSDSNIVELVQLLQSIPSVSSRETASVPERALRVSHAEIMPATNLNMYSSLTITDFDSNRLTIYRKNVELINCLVLFTLVDAKVQCFCIAQDFEASRDVLELSVERWHCRLESRTHSTELETTIKDISVVYCQEGTNQAVRIFGLEENSHQSMVDISYSALDRFWSRLYSRRFVPDHRMIMNLGRVRVNLIRQFLSSSILYCRSVIRGIKPAVCPISADSRASFSDDTLSLTISRRRANSERILNELIINLDYISVDIGYSDLSLVNITMNNGSLMSSSYVSKTLFKSSIGQLIIVDKAQASEMLTPLLCIDTNSGLTIQIYFFKDETPNDRVTVNFICKNIQLVYINRFVNDFIQYSSDSLALLALLNDSLDVSTTSCQGCVSEGSVQLPVGYEVTIDKITVLIPDSCTGSKLIVVGAGCIHAINDVEEQLMDENGARLENIHATVDQINVAYNQNPISQWRKGSGEVLIDPFDVKVDCKMKFGFSKTDCSLEISLNVGDISLNIDYALISGVWRTLMMNSYESRSSDDSIESIAPSFERQHKTPLLPADNCSIHATKLNEQYNNTSNNDAQYCSFRVNCSKLTYRLFTVNSALDVTHCPDMAEPFAELEIRTISIGAEMSTDATVTAQIHLDQCFFGGRLSRNHMMIAERMEHTNEAFLDLSVTSESGMRNMNIEIEMAPTMMKLCPVYIALLYELFRSLAVISSSPIKQNTQRPLNTPSNPDHIPVKSLGKTVITFRQPLFSVNFVQNSSDVEVEGLYVNSKLYFSVLYTDEGLSLSSFVEILGLSRCMYLEKSPYGSPIDFVSPLNISFLGTLAEFKEIMLKMSLSDITVFMDPKVFSIAVEIHSSLMDLLSVSTTSHVETTEAKQMVDFWQVREYNPMEFWFLSTLPGRRTSSNVHLKGRPISTLQEMFEIELPKLQVLLQKRASHGICPLIKSESEIKVVLNDWNSNLLLEFVISIELSYFNARCQEWEPIVELIEQSSSIDSKFVPCELRGVLQNQNIPVETDTDNCSTSPNYEVAILSMSVSIERPLNLNITRTFVRMINDLSVVELSDLEPLPAENRNMATCISVTNLLGVDVVLAACITANSIDSVRSAKTRPSRRLLQTNSTTLIMLPKNDKLKLDFPWSIEICADIDGRRLFTPHTDASSNLLVATDSTSSSPLRLLTLRSHIDVKNHLNFPISIHFKETAESKPQLDCMVPSKQCSPLTLKAADHCQFGYYFSTATHKISSSPLNLTKDGEKDELHLIQCPSAIRGQILCIYCDFEHLPAFKANSKVYSMTGSWLRIHIRPFVVINNLLPQDLIYTCKQASDNHTILPGGILHLPYLHAGQTVALELCLSEKRILTCEHVLDLNSDRVNVLHFVSDCGGTRQSLSLGMHSQKIKGTLYLSIFSPFWMINNTKLNLNYRSRNNIDNIVTHDGDNTEPVLFSFDSSEFFGKKEVMLSVENGDFSPAFSLDTPGDTGLITCRLDDKVYNILVQIKMSHTGLTRQVFLSCGMSITNRFPLAVNVREHSKNSLEYWQRVGAQESCPLWPSSANWDQPSNRKLICQIVHYDETVGCDFEFSYSDSYRFVFPLKTKESAIVVTVQVLEYSTEITFQSFVKGMAPAQLINHTESRISFWQTPVEPQRTLLPDETCFFTWEDFTDDRTLKWKIDNHEGSDALLKDKIETFVGPGGQQIYYLSFLNGLQRTLVFTLDASVLLNCQNAIQLACSRTRVIFSSDYITISLIDDVVLREVLLLHITSSVQWDCQVLGKPFRKLEKDQSLKLERLYAVHTEGAARSVEDQPSIVQTEDGMKVDFGRMQIVGPVKRTLRRTYTHGVWLQFYISEHYVQAHVKVNTLQVDNPCSLCTFPVVMAPVINTRSSTFQADAKPFIEASLMQSISENKSLVRINFLKLLVQEFHLRIDRNSITSLLEFIDDGFTHLEGVELMHKDLAFVRMPIEKLSNSYEQANTRYYFDYMHLSPIKINFSFSLSEDTGRTSQNLTFVSSFFDVFLQSVGVTFTEVDGVILKLACIQRENESFSDQQLLRQLLMHYMGQAAKQFYAMVLGLSVMGNPYGLVLGVKQGLTDLFYEPAQGAVQGPEEFAEGLVLGFRSFLGHVVGGTTGAMARIIGTFGKGVAALTMDPSYMRRRREMLARRPAGVMLHLTQGGRGLVQGVLDGFTGIVRSPIHGVRHQGTLGLFKGLGIGITGIATRPASVAIDFAAGLLNIIRKTIGHEDLSRVRPSRHFRGHDSLRYYSLHEAAGAAAFREIIASENAAETEVYCAHVEDKIKNHFLFVSSSRLIMVHFNNGWSVEWTCEISKLKKVTVILSTVVLLTFSKSAMPINQKTEQVVLKSKEEANALKMAILNLTQS